MKKIKYSILDRFCSESRHRLNLDPRLVESTGPDIEIALIRTKVRIDEQFLTDHPQLKLVVSATSGFDHIDVEASGRRGIRVSFCPEGNVHSAAELTLALALNLFRKISEGQKKVTRGDWDRESILGRELFGKSWGVVGLGRIGQRVAKMANSFGCEVLAFDPYVHDDVFDNYKVERVGLKELLKASDILSLHVPLTPKTKFMINARTLELLNSTSILINTSRGGVIQESDLIDCLKRGGIAGCAMDVFSEEPLNPQSVFLKLPNLLLTPHIGANTREAFERSCRVAAERVFEYLDGQQVSGNPMDEQWYIETMNEITENNA